MNQQLLNDKMYIITPILTPTLFHPSKTPENTTRFKTGSDPIVVTFHDGKERQKVRKALQRRSFFFISSVKSYQSH